MRVPVYSHFFQSINATLNANKLKSDSIIKGNFNIIILTFIAKNC